MIGGLAQGAACSPQGPTYHEQVSGPLTRQQPYPPPHSTHHQLSGFNQLCDAKAAVQCKPHTLCNSRQQSVVHTAVRWSADLPRALPVVHMLPPYINKCPTLHQSNDWLNGCNQTCDAKRCCALQAQHALHKSWQRSVVRTAAWWSVDLPRVLPVVHTAPPCKNKCPTSHQSIID